MDESDVSALFNINKFHSDGLGALKEVSYFGQEQTSFEQYIQSKMGVSHDMIEELSSVTGMKTLECDGEPANKQDLLKIIPSDLQLLTTDIQKAKLENTDSQKKERGRHTRYKYNDGPWKQALLAAQDAATESLTTIPRENPPVMLSVRIYKYFNPKKQRGIHFIPQSHFYVFGNQKLTELRDMLECPADATCIGEYSDMPDVTVDVTAKDMYKSGFFYIEGVFYNDMRDPGCRDYSETIIKWASEPNRGIGPFISKSMESVKFEDLKLRIGQPYVYMHQGDCEHVVIFTDLRLLHPSECHDISKYPLQIYKAKDAKVKCRVCLMNTARWVTKESCLSPENPCFFCETCFRAFHYDIDGNKLDDFKAYHMPKT